MSSQLRTKEWILVTSITLIGILYFFVQYYSLSPVEMATKYEAIYLQNNVPYHPVLNLLLPQISQFLIPYIVFVAINYWISPSFRRNRNWLSLSWQLALISFLFALGVNIASYYGHPHLFNYGLADFHFLAWFGYNDQPLTHLFAGIGPALLLTSIYFIWTLVRTSIQKRWLAPEFQFRVTIIDQFLNFLILATLSYIILYCFIAPDLFERLHPFLVGIIGVFLFHLIIVNILSPSGNSTPVNIQNLIILLITAIISTLPFFWSLWATSDRILYALGMLLFQIFITTPISYYVYTQKKDKITTILNLEKQLTQSKANLQQLRSQINPHFLFNALNSLYGTALLESSPKTADGIQQLGDMMRYMLHDNQADFIDLEKEIQYLENYITLQRLRVASNQQIDIEVAIESPPPCLKIIPMTLIPFVENAFKYGISLQHPSWINIELVFNNQSLHFQVKNSLHNSKSNESPQESHGIGLNSLQNRLQLFYPNHHQISCKKNQQEYIAELFIELQQNESYA